MDIIIAPRIEKAVKSMKATSKRDIARFAANSERGEYLRNLASFRNISNMNSTFRRINLTDETRGYDPGEVSEFPVLGARFDHVGTHSSQLFRTLKLRLPLSLIFTKVFFEYIKCKETRISLFCEISPLLVRNGPQKRTFTSYLKS